MTNLFFYSSLIAPFITVGASLLLIGNYGARGVAMATLVTAVFNGLFGVVMLQYKKSFFTKK